MLNNVGHILQIAPLKGREKRRILDVNNTSLQETPFYVNVQ